MNPLSDEPIERTREVRFSLFKYRQVAVKFFLNTNKASRTLDEEHIRRVRTFALTFNDGTRGYYLLNDGPARVSMLTDLGLMTLDTHLELILALITANFSLIDSYARKPRSNHQEALERLQ